MKRKFAILANWLLAVCLLASIQSGYAASATWSGGATDTNAADWNDGANWSGGVAPGATSGTANTDTATFNSAPGAIGNSANPIIIDSTSQNIREIMFTGAAGSYTIGSASGSNALLFSLPSPANVTLTNLTGASLVTETFNTPIVIEGTALTLQNNSVNGTGAGSGALVFNGGISAVTSATMYLTGTSTNANAINGVISGNINLQVYSGSTWVFSGLNTYTGSTKELEGILSFNTIANYGVASALGAATSGAIQVGNNQAGAIGVGELQYTGATASSDRAIAIENGAAGGGAILEVASPGTTLTLSGGITTAANSNASTLTLQGQGNGVLSGAITGSGGAGTLLSLTKRGSGMWTLGGVNTYTGATLVNSGTLSVTGSLANTAVTVSNGATFTGTGTVGGPTTILGGGTLAAGTSVGTTLSLLNGLTMNSESVLSFVLGADNAHSTLVLGGSDSFAPDMLVEFMNLQAGTYSDLITGLSSDPGTETSWTLTNADGYSATFTYNDGDISAVVVAVPEPPTWGMLVCGIGAMAMGLFFRRREAGTKMG